MRAGGGKKHGWYYIGDGLVDTASTPTLSQIRARSTSSSPAIRSRLSASQLQVQQLQVISDLFIVTQFLHMFPLLCNIGMNNCRPDWTSKKGHTRQP